jgi:5,6-dimethylbenzimidazole synthase
MDCAALLELMRQRRTVRLYTAEAVELDDIRRVLEAARWAPTGANAQPCEFVVVTQRAALDRIDVALRERRQRRMALRATASEKFALPSKDALGDGTALIIVCADPRTRWAFPSSAQADLTVAEPEHTYWASLGAVVENLHLAAAALGYGIVWISVDPDMGDVLRELLEIPADLDIAFCCPIGRPARTPPVPSRRAFDEIVHWERYDPARARTAEQVKTWLNVGRIAGWKSGNGYAD